MDDCFLCLAAGDWTAGDLARSVFVVDVVIVVVAVAAVDGAVDVGFNRLVCAADACPDVASLILRLINSWLVPPAS